MQEKRIDTRFIDGISYIKENYEEVLDLRLTPYISYVAYVKKIHEYLDNEIINCLENKILDVEYDNILKLKSVFDLDNTLSERKYILDVYRLLHNTYNYKKYNNTNLLTLLGSLSMSYDKLRGSDIIEKENIDEFTMELILFIDEIGIKDIIKDISYPLKYTLKIFKEYYNNKKIEGEVINFIPIWYNDKNICKLVPISKLMSNDKDIVVFKYIKNEFTLTVNSLSFTYKINGQEILFLTDKKIDGWTSKNVKYNGKSYYLILANKNNIDEFTYLDIIDNQGMIRFTKIDIFTNNPEVIKFIPDDDNINNPYVRSSNKNHTVHMSNDVIITRDCSDNSINIIKITENIINKTYSNYEDMISDNDSEVIYGKLNEHGYLLLYLI